LILSIQESQLLPQDLELQRYQLDQKILQIQAVHWVLVGLMDQVIQDLLLDHLGQVNQAVQLVQVVLRCLSILMDPVAQVTQEGHYHPLILLILVALMVRLVQEVPHRPVHLRIH
jgi:hypothetical protein